jgi:hypothetical protein
LSAGVREGAREGASKGTREGGSEDATPSDANTGLEGKPDREPGTSMLLTEVKPTSVPFLGPFRPSGMVTRGACVSAEELSAGVFGMPFDMLVHYECMLLKGNGKSGGDTGGSAVGAQASAGGQQESDDMAAVKAGVLGEEMHVTEDVESEEEPGEGHGVGCGGRGAWREGGQAPGTASTSPAHP